MVNEDQVMKALDFALEHEVHSMKLKSLIESVELAKSRGQDLKAAMLLKRLAELKRVSLIFSDYFEYSLMKSSRSRILCINLSL